MVEALVKSFDNCIYFLLCFYIMKQEKFEEPDLNEEKSNYEEAIHLFIEIFPYVFVNYDLDSLYYEDREKAFDLARQCMAEEKLPAQKRFTCVPNFLLERDELYAKIENIDENDNDEMMLLLFQLVRLFESIVNEYVYHELYFRDFTRKEIKKVQLKLNTEEKLGWFLKLTNGKDYTDNKNWSSINKYILARNFYIHHAPDTFETYDNHEKVLTKASFMEFLDYSSDCYSFLNECRNKEYIEYFERVSNLRNYMKAEHEKRNPGK